MMGSAGGPGGKGSGVRRRLATRSRTSEHRKTRAITVEVTIVAMKELCGGLLRIGLIKTDALRSSNAPMTPSCQQVLRLVQG